LVFILAGFYLS